MDNNHEPYECFCDECYYHMWRVRRKDTRTFNDGWHVNNRQEAEGLTAELNRLSAKCGEAVA